MELENFRAAISLFLNLPTITSEPVVFSNKGEPKRQNVKTPKKK
jgi:hypothetical protein